MNSYSRPSCWKNAEVLGRLTLAEMLPVATRPSALRALLLLSGATHPGDAALARTTDAELALVQEVLEMLHRSEPANTA